MRRRIRAQLTILQAGQRFCAHITSEGDNVSDDGEGNNFLEELYAEYMSGAENVGGQWEELFRRWRAEGRQPAQNRATKPDPLQRKIHSSVDRQATAADEVTRSDLPPKPRAAAQPAITPYAQKLVDRRRPTETVTDEKVVLKGADRTVAKNMDKSISVPVATSVREIPCRLLLDNREIINSHLAMRRGGKVSITHLLSFAMVEALVEMPEMNVSYALDENDKPVMVKHENINFGLAVDVQGPDNQPALVVPSVKAAETMSFSEFVGAYEELVDRARERKLTVDDLTGTTASLTNPGGFGTTHSIPRLMAGQGLVLGVGAMDYPAQFRGTSDAALASLGVSKVVTLTSTYDHRVIQGATSGRFLKLLEEKLLGLDGFYDRVFVSLRIPNKPFKWEKDREYDPVREMPKAARINDLITAYRTRGHLIADTDPVSFRIKRHPDLEMASYGLTIWDLDRTFPTGGFAGTTHMTLRETLDRLRAAYTRTIGVEYVHIQDPSQREWFYERLETRPSKPSRERQIQILRKLGEAETFETFLQTKFVGQKRFSLEGAESLIPALDSVLQAATDHGLSDVAIGMTHRGRLNVLSNIAGKSYAQIFSEFDEFVDPGTQAGSGDVKYHLGTEGTYTSPEGGTINVYLAANPSHLEAVDSVLEGVVRAKQDVIGMGDEYPVLPILIHGDAAFAGQGVVAEVLNMSQLPGYRTGGTVHFIINNQIGFTTSPSDSRSTTYATDIARGQQIPIFHVNADDPEAVCRVSKLAFDYRTEFHKDAIVDLMCYRKRGHNEGDDPKMTQPVMYSLISSKRSTKRLYEEALIGRGELTAEEAEQVSSSNHVTMDDSFAEVRQSHDYSQNRVESAAASLGVPQSQLEDAGTMVGWQSAIPAAVIERIGMAHTDTPEGFETHPKIAKLFEQRFEMSKNGNIDWGFAELLAFGSLLIEGVPVRLTGQDSRRGTFAQRHATVHSQNSGAEWTPLENLAEGQAAFEIYDSPLSEYSVVGFEYGYSVERPDALVIWEAQYGDFANGGQIIIDEFIASAQSKWGQSSSLTLFLPHGYEGKGPDHSSARIERYLQLCAEDNLLVVQPTTPANHFHLLRHQAFARPRRPLIEFTPKQLLRLRANTSSVADFTSGEFQPVIGDPTHGDGARRILLCSGRIYYDLVSERERRGAESTAIVRLEQLYPHPIEAIRAELARSPEAELVWVQDEPANQGAWSHLALNVFPVLGRGVKLASRPASASPATGIHSTHDCESRDVLDLAFA